MIDNTHEQFIQTIALALGETQKEPQRKIELIIRYCGKAFVEELFNETQRIEADGGLMVKDGTRRRTPGGVFFTLVKNRLKREKRYKDLDDISQFDHPGNKRRKPRLPSMHTLPKPPISRPMPPVIPRIRPRRKPAITPPHANDALLDNTTTHAPRDTTTEYPIDQQLAMSLARQVFGDDCYKVSANYPLRQLTVRFYFPDVAMTRHRETIADVEAQTGWSVQCHPLAHQNKLMEVAQTALPETIALITEKPLSLYEKEKTVAVRYYGASLDDTAIAAAQARFNETTGWVLSFCPVQGTVQ